MHLEDRSAEGNYRRQCDILSISTGRYKVNQAQQQVVMIGARLLEMKEEWKLKMVVQTNLSRRAPDLTRIFHHRA